MPSLDAFLGLQLDDANGIQSWLLAHKSRHQTYAYAASRQGLQTPPYVLDGVPDDDWFQNHANMHYSIQSLMAPDQTVDLTLLTQYTWDDNDSFQAWMQMHTLIHDRLDEGLQIT